MASHLITVLVRPLLGDVLAVKVDPTLGLKGVADALSLEDPVAYPSARTRVFFVDPDADTLTSDSVLGLVVSHEPLCQLIATKEITLPGTNASYKVSYIDWTFRLENEKEVHFYFRLQSNAPQFNVSPFGYHTAPTSGYITIQELLMKYVYEMTIRNIHSDAVTDLGITLRDAYVIQHVLEKLSQPYIEQITADWQASPRYGWSLQQTRTEGVQYCECGHIIKSQSMKQHLSTKVKHPKGDEAGKAFLAAADAYIASL